MSELRIGELHQVTIGTILLGFALECMLALAMYCGSGILEHPKDSEDAASGVYQCCVCFYMFLQFPGMRFVHFSQGFFGAPTPKPTTLLVLRLPALERHLHEGMLSSKLLYGTSVGKNDKGQFHKNILQIPPGFCKAIAHSFVSDICTESASMDYSALPELPSSFLDFCNKMCDHDFGLFIPGLNVRIRI